MFEAEIDAANSMLARLEAEAQCPAADRDDLPAHQRVRVTEAVAWEEAVERKAQQWANPELLRRLALLSHERQQRLAAGEGDELSRFILHLRATVGVLRQAASGGLEAPSAIDP